MHSDQLLTSDSHKLKFGPYAVFKIFKQKLFKKIFIINKLGMSCKLEVYTEQI